MGRIGYFLPAGEAAPALPSFGDRIHLWVYTLATLDGPACDSIEIAGVLGDDDIPLGLAWPLLGLREAPEFRRALVVDAALLDEWYGCNADDETHTIRMTLLSVDSSQAVRSGAWLKEARLGLAAHRAGAYAEAARLLEPAARKRSRDLAYQCLYAGALRATGQREAYARVARRIADVNPQRLDASRLKGWR